MSGPRYGSYRDSGVEWLGDVPSHWPIVRIGRVFQETADAGSDELPILSVSIHDGVSDDELAPDDVERKVTRSEDRSKYKKVAPGDLVYNMMRAWQGGFGAVRVQGMVSPAYVVARPKEAGIETLFIEQLLRTPMAIEEMRRRSRGVTDFRLRLYWDEFKDIHIPLPPPSEQAAIAAFLDRETAKIDALVEEQRRLIALLAEKRQAVISHAVTKGLDPTVPMKDSGVEWLGEVPAHWTVAPLKRFIHLLSGFAFPSLQFSQDPADTRLLRGVNIGVGHIRWDETVYWPPREGGGFGAWELAVGDVVLGMDRPWISGGLRIARLSANDVPCLLLQRVAALRPKPNLAASYLQYLLEGDAFFHHCVPEMTGVSVPHISPGQVGDFIVALPLLSEQEQILHHINAVGQKMQTLVAETENAIALLQERRAALISAAVTGKIDVRDLVPAVEEAA